MFSWAQLAYNELNNSLETFYYFSHYLHNTGVFFGLAKRGIVIPAISALLDSVVACN